MTQADTLKFFQKNPDKWFFQNELKEKLKIGNNSINNNLIRLFKQKLILRKEVKVKSWRKYQYKLR
jgi:predicted transcriptional regulator